MSNDFNYDAYQYGNKPDSETEGQVNFTMYEPQKEEQQETQYNAPKPKKKV